MKRHAPQITWTVALVLLIVGALRFRLMVRELRAEGETQKAADVTLPKWPTQDSLFDAATLAVDLNPFRPDRGVPSVEPQAPPPQAPVPTVAQPVLRGLVGGPPWSAIIQGLPNTNGPILLRVGDTVSGYSIAHIRRDTVVLRNQLVVYTLSPSLP